MSSKSDRSCELQVALAVSLAMLLVVIDPAADALSNNTFWTVYAWLAGWLRHCICTDD